MIIYVFNRQTGQDTADELRSRDFRKELEDRERSAFKEKSKEKGSRTYGESSSKKSRLEILTTSNLDMDDPVDDDDDDDSDDRHVSVELNNINLGKFYFSFAASRRAVCILSIF